jgi:hypothetical protein
VPTPVQFPPCFRVESLFGIVADMLGLLDTCSPFAFYERIYRNIPNPTLLIVKILVHHRFLYIGVLFGI